MALQVLIWTDSGAVVGLSLAALIPHKASLVWPVHLWHKVFDISIGDYSLALASSPA